MSEVITPVEFAKNKIANLFRILNPHQDSHWNETMLGSTVAIGGIEAGMLCADIDSKGNYIVTLDVTGNYTIPTCDKKTVILLKGTAPNTFSELPLS